jgi:RNA polymerase sigma factor (sigma-70 family)
MDDTERARIVELARQQIALGCSRLHQVSQRVARQTGRAVETVRYTLRRHDREHPVEALFAEDGAAKRPVADTQEAAICRCFDRGDSPADLASQFKRSKTEILRLVLASRARDRLASKIEYIYNPEFDAANADQIILTDPPDEQQPDAQRPRVPSQLPPYLQQLYRFPLLGPDKEFRLFRRYNYLKFKAAILQQALDASRVRRRHLQAIDGVFEQANAVKNQIIQANLRLVVSIARRHVGAGPDFFEVISDGNLSLMRAVERFDYSRGVRFSTYASWAIMKNYARSIPQEAYYHRRFRTDAELALDLAAERLASEPPGAGLREGLVELLDKVLGALTDREQTVLRSHYGLGAAESPLTLEQIGHKLGVSKERVRQIERAALAKLRSAAGHLASDYLPA